MRTESGSRLVQHTLSHCLDSHLLLTCIRWLEQNIANNILAVLSKPAVYLAVVVMEMSADELR